MSGPRSVCRAIRIKSPSEEARTVGRAEEEIDGGSPHCLRRSPRTVYLHRMESTVVVAGMGFVATLAGAWITAKVHRQVALEERILDAKVRVFGGCADTLYEYERATFNRVKARLTAQPDTVCEKHCVKRLIGATRGQDRRSVRRPFSAAIRRG